MGKKRDKKRKKKEKQDKKELAALPQAKIEVQTLSEENPDDAFSCEDLESEYCEEIIEHKFSKDPVNLFSEIKYIEDRFQEELRAYNAEWIKKIQDLQDTKDKEYQNIIRNRKKSLQKNVEEIGQEIEKNISTLKAQEQMILSEIDILYKLNLDKLIDQAFQTMRLTFLDPSSSNKTPNTTNA